MLWCFAYRLGIRKGELLKLVWEWLLPYRNETEPFIKVPGFRRPHYEKRETPHNTALPSGTPRICGNGVSESGPQLPVPVQYRGKRLRNIRTGFEKACREAGHEEVIFHDTRRTAVRRMEDAGIPRREAMEITGHLTETVYKRYDIGSEAGATEAGRRLREHEFKGKFFPKFSPNQDQGTVLAASASKRKSLN